ncbi:MAG: type II toxin-antitoxin system Phd/YefM family antitoxin [Solirubrobacterales bacterium]
MRRVQAGEALEVTEHGHPVARLAPLVDERLSTLHRLILDGRARAPLRDHRSLPPPLVLLGRPLSEILREMRDEERW